MSDESLGNQLVIICEQDSAAKIKIAFRDYDSVGIFDERFVLWRYHSGKVACSENPEHARTYRTLLKSLQPRSKASYRQADTVRCRFFLRITSNDEDTTLQISSGIAGRLQSP